MTCVFFCLKGSTTSSDWGGIGSRRGSRDVEEELREAGPGPLCKQGLEAGRRPFTASAETGLNPVSQGEGMCLHRREPCIWFPRVPWGCCGEDGRGQEAAGGHPLLLLAGAGGGGMAREEGSRGHSWDGLGSTSTGPGVTGREPCPGAQGNGILQCPCCPPAPALQVGVRFLLHMGRRPLQPGPLRMMKRPLNR